MGLESIKKELAAALDDTTNPEGQEFYKEKHKKCFLLTGPPACGKSHLMEAFVGEAYKKNSSILFFDLYLRRFLKDEKNLLKYLENLETASKETPCIIAIFELFNDSFYGSMNWAKEEIFRKTFSKIEKFLNNNPAGKDIILIVEAGPDVAEILLRDYNIFPRMTTLALPSYRERKEFFTKKLEQLVSNLQAIEIDALAQQTDDCTYLGLEAILNTALMKSKLSGLPIAQTHLEESLREEIDMR